MVVEGRNEEGRGVGEERGGKEKEGGKGGEREGGKEGLCVWMRVLGARLAWC
jgi:hypothetical protein